jgi:hypothetical protein
MTRILAAARLQLVAWPARLAWPWFILALSFGVNLALFSVIGPMIPGGPITGGLASIYVMEFIVWAQTISQVLPLALGLSMTRKSFYVASLLIVVARSAAFALVLWSLKLVEDATHGWGMSLPFFGIKFLVQDNGFLQFLSYAVLFVLLDLVGVLAGVIVKRWGINGMFTATAATVGILGGTAILLTWQRQWQGLFDWVSGQPTIALIAGWPLLLALAMAAGGFLAIRRATPA